MHFSPFNNGSSGVSESFDVRASPGVLDTPKDYLVGSLYQGCFIPIVWAVSSLFKT